MEEISRGPSGTPDGGGDGAPPARPFTLASLGFSVAVCLAWWSVGLAAFFGYASSRSASVAASGCTAQPCPSQRTALLVLGYFGLLPTAFVGVLVSLVVLVYAARSVRIPWVLGTISALSGMLLGAIGFVTIATYDWNR